MVAAGDKLSGGLHGIKFFCLISVSYTHLVVGLAACSGVQIEGSWIEPVPGMPEMVQGVTLENGGRATSINMATLHLSLIHI